jgi:hypothetical protein
MHSIDPGLLAELATKHPIAAVAEAARESIEAAAARLRSIFADHPKQAAFYRRNPANSLRATTKTRRAGATAGGVREFLARALEQPGFRGTYTTTTRIEAFERAWENDTQSGFAQVLRALGDPTDADIETVTFGGVRIEIRIGDLALEFSNGSRIDLYGADNLRALRKKRGGAKHVFWVDEAQDFPFLDVFYKAVVVAALTDYNGECWLTGTPGRDCAGFFYDVTGDEEHPVAGWDVHVLAAVDNPFFGRVVQADDAWYVDDNLGVRHGPYVTRSEASDAARDVRWENAAGAAIRKNNFKEDDPDVLRELFGRWVKGDARFVYPVHAVAGHVLIYAPQRLLLNTFRPGDPQWLDIDTALADLPINRRARRAYQWMFAVGADFGYHPDPFALVVWAFTQELPDVYEVFSWKQTKVNTDDQGAYMKMLWDALPNVVSFVGDVDGKKDDVEVWVNRMNLPIEPAKKQGKNMLEELLAGDIRKGRVHLREGSPLLTEMKHLVYLPAKPGKTREVDKHRKVNGIEHGDHCCDAGRYSFADLTHYLHRAPEEQKADTPEQRLEQDRKRYEKAVDKADERARREREEAEFEARWGIPDRPSEEEEMYGY